MSGLSIDAELLAALKTIRETLRALFEELRLRGEVGDATGKERLERVPAFSKRNFRNLNEPDHVRAAREAWRLIDFLEGSEPAELTRLAREGLRTVELDRRLGQLRKSEEWRSAADRLRTVVDVCGPTDRASHTSPTKAHKVIGSADQSSGDPSSRSRPWTSSAIAIAGISLIAAALVVFASLVFVAHLDDGRGECMAFETAKEEDALAHRTIDAIPSEPLPERDAGMPDREFVIEDDKESGEVRSIFITSQYSYETKGVVAGPGGGQADDRLRIGGWGDTYVAVIKIPVLDQRPVRRAMLRLTVKADDPDRTEPTAMLLRAIDEPWSVPSGRDQRLWWRDCPRSAAIMRLPAPGAPETAYEINITDLYNAWAAGSRENHGVMLEPQNIGIYGPSVQGFAHFSTFYSTRASAEKRPRLILSRR